MKRYLILLVLVMGWSTAALRAQEPADSLAETTVAPSDAAGEDSAAELSDEALWDKANTAYINNEFGVAAANYELLAGRGASSAKLYYNWGNACFKEGRTGEAILRYRRALRLAPGNADIRHNLAVAEAETKDDIEAIPEFFLATWLRGVRHTMGCTAWTLLSLGFLLLAAGAFLLYLLAARLTLRKAGFYGTLAAGALFALATAFAAGERRELRDRTQAVVMVPAVSVKSSPDRSAKDLFVLHEGTTVRIVDRLEEWCEVAIADGKKGWIEAKRIEII